MYINIITNKFTKKKKKKKKKWRSRQFNNYSLTNSSALENQFLGLKVKFHSLRTDQITSIARTNCYSLVAFLKLFPTQKFLTENKQPINKHPNSIYRYSKKKKKEKLKNLPIINWKNPKLMLKLYHLIALLTQKLHLTKLGLHLTNPKEILNLSVRN